MTIEVCHSGTETGILVAEAVVGAIEVLFATALELDAFAHVEKFDVEVIEEEVAQPRYAMDEHYLSAKVFWPTGLSPAAAPQQVEVQKMLAALTATIFGATCKVKDPAAVMSRLIESEALFDRLAMVVVSGNSRHRIFGKNLVRLSDWGELAKRKFALQPAAQPKITPIRPDSPDQAARFAVDSAGRPVVTDHRDLIIHSVVDANLWDKAGWSGVVFADWGEQYPPGLGLMFKNVEVGRKIFERWQARFGRSDKREEIYVALVRRISSEHPAHYRALITSNPKPLPERGRLVTFASRLQTMEASSDINLRRFLEGYAREAAFLLMPSYVGSDGQPVLLSELALLKRRITVKDADEVGENDIEQIALPPNKRRISSA
jgi:hypothetical protein